MGEQNGVRENIAECGRTERTERSAGEQSGVRESRECGRTES